MISCIHFIRHGKTEGSEKKWFYGVSDVPLIKEGIEDAKRLKEEGIYPEYEDMDYYTTGLGRTEETLKVIYGDVPHKQIPNLKEFNFGIFECKNSDDLKDIPEFKTWHQIYKDGIKSIDEKWLNGPNATKKTVGGESIKEFFGRIESGLNELRNYHSLKELSNRHSGKDTHSVMICHGGVTSTCMSILFPGEKDFWAWKPEPGRGYSVFFENGKPVSWKKL